MNNSEGALSVIRRGLKATPELVQGLYITVGIGLAVAAGQVVIPIVIQLAIDRGGLTSGEVDIDTVLRLVSIGLVVVVTTSILGLVTKRRLIFRAEKSLASLRNQAFDHVHRLSLADHNESQTGVLISRVTSDVDSLGHFMDWGMLTWIIKPIVIVGVFIAMAFYSWQLALLAFVAFLPVIPILGWVQRRMVRAHDRRRTAIGVLLGSFGEALSGAEVVRAYGAEDRTRDRLENASQERYRSGISANLYMSGVYVTGDFVSAIMLALVLAVGITQREALGLTAGGLTAIAFLVVLLLEPVAELGETLDQAQQAVAGWRKVLDVLDTPIEDLDPEFGEELPAGAIAIEAHGIGFAYRNSEPVLDDVSVSIPAGSRVAIVGETGSGKSTFARLLCRLADPSQGYITLNGVRLDQMSTDSRHAGVRLVPQDGFLFNGTIRENISFGRPGTTSQDIAKACETLNLESWVASMPSGLDTKVGERGSALSVGERQLVSFARATVANPGLLILDEATSSVDPETDQKLTRALDRLAERRTLVSIAHRLSTAEAADLVLVFDRGRLAEQGSHDDLVAAGGLYAGLYDAWTVDSAAV